MGREGKVFWGVKKAAYAIATIASNGSATYGNPVDVPGSVSMQASPKGESGYFYADDTEYYDLVSSEGYDINWEVARIPDVLREALLGYQEDSNGILVENANAEPVHFALLFETQTDQGAVRHVFYNLIANRNEMNHKTKEASKNPGTETIPCTARSIYIPDMDIWTPAARTSADVNPTAFSEWFEEVKVPTPAGSNNQGG